MASEIKVDTIVNAGGDNDTGIDLSTNDVVKVNIAGAEKARVHSDGKVGIGTNSPDYSVHVKGAASQHVAVESTNNTVIGAFTASTNDLFIGTVSNDNFVFETNATERMRILSTGVVLVNKTADNETDVGVALSSGGSNFVRSGGGLCSFNRLSNDGDLVFFKQATSTEGKVSVSGSTVSYEGFSGLHESSGIPTNTPMGTVLSTIDELDVYYAKQDGINGEEDNPKAGQTRADHAKVEVSDTVGDSAVYGVVGKFNTQGKVMVASVGIGSVRVTGACAKGDLLESNGDGTAKVQSDDIVRSKTIGKVTIGNSSTDVKLVSCVLYCG